MFGLVEAIFAGRMYSDYFWNFKFISIFFGLLVIFTSLIFSYKNLREKCQIKSIFEDIMIVDIYILAFMLCVFISFIIDANSDSMAVLFKIICSCFCFFIGRHCKNFSIKNFWLYYIPVLSFVVFSYLKGTGYEYWGNVHTFVGGYFYKTDLALAISVFLVFMLVSDMSVRTKVLSIFILSYFVFLSNSRAYYVIYFFLALAWPVHSYLIKNKVSFLKVGIIFFSISFLAITLYSIISTTLLSSSSLLLFDTDDLAGEKNLQGRNYIWENLIDIYYNYPLHNKLFGGGLVADVKAAARMEVLDTMNAHNSFLFLLVCCGFFGFLIFVLFLKNVISRNYRVLKNRLYRNNEKYHFVSLCMIFIFLFSGFSNSTIIYQQQTWFFMFFSGLLYNVNYFNLQSK
jgi:hypothetical protein